MKSKFANIFIWICLISIVFTQKQIDTFNILFPQVNKQTSGRPIELVTASGGCFQWTSSSSQIVNVKGLSKGQQNCHNRGLVELKHIGPYQGSIYITATNIETHQLSNIPVRISPIHKIEIIAKSRLMNRNEMQDLKIFAYDQEQNMFTSLEGLKFFWQLVDSNNILSKISLKNSHLSLPLQERKDIEKRGAQSDILVVKGESPGKSIVRVRCIEPGYEHLKHQITISVQQRFLINPSQAVYLIAYSTYNFGLISPSRETIAIPKPYYKASMTSKLFKVSDSLQVIAPSTQDQTVLKVEDTRTVPSFSSDVTIYSKIPTSMALKVDEYVIVGQENKVDVELFWNKQLLNGETKDYKINTELSYNEIKKTIKGQSRTTATVKATYKTLVAEKRVHVVLPLTIVLPSHKITLPIDETFELKAIGGSGVYDYQIDNEIAVISASGVITSKKQGQAKITIIDKRVPRNQLILKLVVSPLGSIIPLQAKKELNINEFGPIFTMAKGKNQEQYTKCSQQQIQLNINHLPHLQVANKASLGNSLPVLTAKMSKSPLVKELILRSALLPFGVEDFVSKFSTYIKAGDISMQELQKYASELQNYGICSVHWLKSSQQFDTQLSVFDRANINVKAKFFLRIYDQISNLIESSQKDYFLITPGSELIWKNEGGSQQWGESLKILLNSVEESRRWPRIKCPQQQTVLQMKLQIFNIESRTLLLPVNQSKTIYIHCKYPSKLKIKFENQEDESNVMNGLKDKIIKGSLIPLDNKGDTFYNSSNLVYENEKSAGQIKIFSDKFEFNPANINSSKVTFWTEKIQGGKSNFKRVSASFNYEAKEMFTLSPHPEKNHLISLYNPKKSYTFVISKISDSSEVICEGSISCFYTLSTKHIRVNTTRLGSGSMKIVDKTIYQNPSLTIKFDVVDADEIVLQLTKHTVQVQKKLYAEVKLFYQRILIPSWQYDSRNLLIVHEAGLRSTQVQGIQNQNNLYEISAQKSGTYRITVEQHSPSYLQSSPLLLTVYPKFDTNIQNTQYVYTKDQVLQMKGQVIVAVDCIRKVHIFGGPAHAILSHSTYDQDLFEVKYNKQSKQFDLIGKQEGKTTITFSISSSQSDGKTVIATLTLLVIVKPIDHVNLYSLDEALINAQFRIIPHLIVDGKALLDSVCNFEYKWTTDNSKIKLQGIDVKNAFGVNATAFKQGDSYVTLQVMKSGQPLFITTKEITVHKSLEIQLPTVIGQHDLLTQTSNNLLIPLNSGYQLQDQTISITKISQSNQNLLTIGQNNKLISGKEKGLVSVKLQKSTDQSYNNYLNVVITPIKALFIENSYNVVKADVGKITNVRFYVQDMYGRLFYNNLFNVEYDIISSNEDVFTVSLDATKNFIRIHPKKHGEGMLMIRLKSGESLLGKINEVPHDFVQVVVGKVLEPQSPIYLAVGGQAHIQFQGRGSDKWQILSGGDCVKVDAATRTIKGIKLGESIVSIGGYQTVVRVLPITVRQKIISEPTPGKASLIVDYVVSGRWNDEVIYFQSISNQFNHINNNLNLDCIAINRNYFTSKSQIIKTVDYDKLRCEVHMNYDFDVEQPIPDHIQVKVVTYDSDNEIVQHHSTKTSIESTFWIPRNYQNILLSSEQYAAEIFVKTPIPLRVQIIGTKNAIFDSQFDSQYKIQVIKVVVNPDLIEYNFEFKLKLTHPHTQQSQQINAKYIIDETRRKAQQQAQETEIHIEQQPIEIHKTHHQPTANNQWHWTDFIILFMGINFIIILFYQSCMNGNDKYKTL